MAREANDVDLDKITFLKLPVYDLEGEYAGRVAIVPERAQLLFDKIANDEPLIIEKANVGTGAVVAEEPVEPDAMAEPDATAEPETTEAATQSATTSTESEALPEWVQGTNASVKTCSS